MKLKKFNSFQEVKEAHSEASVQAPVTQGEVTLYRLTSHSVVDLNDPGEFYVATQEEVTPELLGNKGSELFLLTVTTDSSNIDADLSNAETQSHGHPVVVVKDSTLCSVVNVVPFK